MWHIGWKNRFPEENCEVTIRKDGVLHRADILSRGLVVELQHSSISPKDIRERESFYDRMVWLFDAGPFKGFSIYKGLGANCRFSWEHPRRTILTAERTVYLDLGEKYDERIFKVIKFFSHGYGGFGEFVEFGDFIESIKSGELERREPLQIGLFAHA
jgi:hypothetical protein